MFRKITAVGEFLIAFLTRIRVSPTGVPVTWQAKDGASECVRRWRDNASEFENLLLQTMQTKSLSPVWVGRCRFSRLRFAARSSCSTNVSNEQQVRT